MGFKSYELIEPTVQAATITGLAYTFDDGTTKPAPDTQGVTGSLLIVAADGSTSTLSAADFTAKYKLVG